MSGMSGSFLPTGFRLSDVQNNHPDLIHDEENALHAFGIVPINMMNRLQLRRS